MTSTAYAVEVATAAAQVAADPGVWANINSVLDRLISIMNSPVMGWIMTTGVGLLGGGKWLKNRAVQKWAILAFHTVEEIAQTHPGNEKLDKVALFAETFERYMKRAGWLGLVTKTDIEQAHAIAKSVNVTYSAAKRAVEGVKDLKEDAK